MARLRVGLGIAETDNYASFEVRGSDEWVTEVLPYICYITGAMVKAHGQDPENAAAIGNELTAAHGALKEDKDFHGSFVTVTRTGQSEAASV